MLYSLRMVSRQGSRNQRESPSATATALTAASRRPGRTMVGRCHSQNAARNSAASSVVSRWLCTMPAMPMASGSQSRTAGRSARAMAQAPSRTSGRNTIAVYSPAEARSSRLVSR